MNLQGQRFPVLETPRLVLREIAMDDAPALFAIYEDREHMRWYGIEPFPDLGAVEARIKTLVELRRQANPGTPWAITTQGDGAFIGTCGLFGWNRTWRKCSVGYEIAKSAQGHGYMHEALTAALSWGFQSMAVNRIDAQVHPNNVRSVKLLQRLHFVEEGRLRQAAYWGNQFHDMLQFSMLREDWPGWGSAES
jgi:ribosomal-protein-alanine N-acetyltransferase